MILVTPKILKTIAGRKVYAMALFPFILVCHEDIKKDLSIINHEKIHWRQQIELFILFFYLLYGIFYLYYRLKGQNHFNAYMSIPFEKEAFTNETRLSYIRDRTWFSWVNYF